MYMFCINIKMNWMIYFIQLLYNRRKHRFKYTSKRNKTKTTTTTPTTIKNQTITINDSYSL